MRISGLWVALLTPLETDGRVDHAALQRHMGALAAAGVDGFVPLGTTGEFCEFSRRERAEILATVVRARGALPVLAGVSGLSTRETCELAEDAATAGVDGVLALPPLYWPTSEEGLVRHFREVAEASGLPLVVYDFPGTTGTAVSASAILRAAALDERVVGAKLTVRSPDPILDLLGAVRRERPGFSVVTGFEDMIPATIAAGGAGAISGLANICPEVLVMLVKALHSGGQEAMELYRQVLAMCDVYGLTTPAIPGLKAVAAALGRLPRSTSRVTAEQSDEIDEIAHRWLDNALAIRGLSGPLALP
ncbi:dihydrodipicolinate synthase family protein [Pseudonocardia sp. GCM10023141]|uniref:dihydrodipicolinate synthase family protein n=1 Tax=Pseudonocardia sp. GCM10023141 TaxID=3252653 RepID=UPI00360C06BB